MRLLSLTVAVGILLTGWSSGGEALPPPVLEKAEGGWDFGASIMGYSVPDGEDFLSPLVSADFGRFHFEARHNYEDLDTGSVWLGLNFSMGERLVLDFTPMVGGVFGQTRGIAPGWRLALTAGSFELSNEAEYVFDAESSEDDFLYTWSELTWSPKDWLWLGLVVQKTRTYETDVDIQRGFLVGFTFKEVDFTTYVFNWGWDEPTLVFSIGMEF